MSIDDATPAEWNALRNPPAHYTQGNIEVIEVIRDTLDSEQFKAYCQGQHFEICHAGESPPETSLPLSTCEKRVIT